MSGPGIQPGAVRGGRIAALAGLVLAAAGGAAQAAVYDCALSGKSGALDLRFDLDPASFALPVSSDEPPRRRVSRVEIGQDAFVAEAILTVPGWRGFWAPARGMLMSVAPDGAATLTHGAKGWTGRCEESGG